MVADADLVVRSPVCAGPANEGNGWLPVMGDRTFRAGVTRDAAPIARGPVPVACEATVVTDRLHTSTAITGSARALALPDVESGATDISRAAVIVLRNPPLIGKAVLKGISTRHVYG